MARLASDAEQMSETLAVARALIQNRGDDAALQYLYMHLAAAKRQLTEGTLTRFVEDLDEPILSAIVAPRIEAMLASFERFAASVQSNGAGVASRGADGSQQAADPLSAEYFIGLKNEDEVRGWVEELVRSGNSKHSIEATLGAFMAKETNEDILERLKRFRNVVHDYFDNLDTLE